MQEPEPAEPPPAPPVVLPPADEPPFALPAVPLPAVPSLPPEPRPPATPVLPALAAPPVEVPPVGEPAVDAPPLDVTPAVPTAVPAAPAFGSALPPAPGFSGPPESPEQAQAISGAKTTSPKKIRGTELIFTVNLCVTRARGNPIQLPPTPRTRQKSRAAWASARRLPNRGDDTHPPTPTAARTTLSPSRASAGRDARRRRLCADASSSRSSSR